MERGNPSRKNLCEVSDGEPKAEGNRGQPGEGDAWPRVMGSLSGEAGKGVTESL